MGAGDGRECWPYFPMFYFLTTCEAEAGKKAPGLSALTALAEDPRLGSQHLRGSSQLSVPPVLGDLIHSSSLFGHCARVWSTEICSGTTRTHRN